MDSFKLSSRALDLVARLRLQLQDLAPAEAALARDRFSKEALALCEAHFDNTPSTKVAPAGSSAGLESPEGTQIHLSAQEWLNGATFAACGRRLAHSIALDDRIHFTECPECFGHRPLSHPQILTASEAGSLSRMPRAH